MSGVLRGSCLCGEVEYEIAASPIDAGYCHCRLCQRASGAPVQAWFTVPVDALRYVQGEPSVFRSSTHSQREFCKRCGTQLAFRRIAAPQTVDVTIATLGDPSRVRPEYHIWRGSRIAWFEIADSLPRYDDAGPDKQGD